jgi:hypothetical protein
VLHLSQHLATTKGSAGFPGVFERNERAHGEGHENDQKYSAKLRVHWSEIVLGNLLSLASMAEY